MKASNPLDSLLAALAARPASKEVLSLRAREGELRARVAEIEAAREAHRTSAPSPLSRAAAYLAREPDPVNDRDELAAEAALARDALRLCAERRAQAEANDHAAFVAAAQIDAPIRAQREATVAAAVTLLDALNVARQMTDAAESAGVVLAGARWSGNSPHVAAQVGALIDDLAEIGVAVHPHVRRAARIVSNRSAS
jgi:hypothetical protein